MKIFFTKMLGANELISSFNKPVYHYKQGNVCEVNEVNGQVKWQMSNFSVYYWKTERQALLATRIFLLFGGIFCHFLFLAVKQGIQITFFHGIYINNYWDLENIFHKWDETNTWCKKTTSSNISNMRCSVSSPDETPRRELKIRRAAEYFWRTSRCFIWWWNTVSNVWYFFSNKIIFEGEIKDANTKQCFIRFPNTH